MRCIVLSCICLALTLSLLLSAAPPSRPAPALSCSAALEMQTQLNGQFPHNADSITLGSSIRQIRMTRQWLIRC
jgi:hypothetical protein